MRVKKHLFLFLAIILFVLPISASADSMIEQLIPDEGTMGYSGQDQDFKYKLNPPENYVWDTSLEWFHMDGIAPVIGDPMSIMTNSIATEVMMLNVLISRFAIFLLEYAYSLDFVSVAMGQLKDSIVIMKDFFYERLSSLFFLVLSGFIIVAYAGGRRGLAFRHLFMSLILVAALGGVVENIDFLVDSARGIGNYVGKTVLGTVQLAPFQGDAENVANDRIIQTGNFLWDTTVTQPWKIGEFGSLGNVSVTSEERDKLNSEYKVPLLYGQSWGDVILHFSPGSTEKKAFVKVLSDTTIKHDPQFLPSHLAEGGIMDRLVMSILAIIVSLVAVIFFGILFGFLTLAQVVLVVGAVFSPVFVPVPLLSGIGNGILKRFIGFMLLALALIIAASFYLGIFLMALHVVELIPNFSAFIIVKQILNIVILLVGTIFSPKIWTTITPTVLKAGVNAINSSRVGRGTGRNQEGSYRKLEPQRAENVIERGKNYGQKRVSERAENVIEKKKRERKVDDTSNRQWETKPTIHHWQDRNQAPVNENKIKLNPTRLKDYSIVRQIPFQHSRKLELPRDPNQVQRKRSRVPDLG
ncbi:MAG TPA: hypothetical protein VJ824_15930 [Bacillota bacterium]|nr:hypothetical protein [Bacillota bacterium]